MKLKQDHMGVGDYAQMFETLVRQSELNESPVYTIIRFVKGLNYNISKSISHLIFKTLQKAIQAALREEISFSVAEMVEKTKLLVDTVTNISVDTHIEQVCLVIEDSVDVL